MCGRTSKMATWTFCTLKTVFTTIILVAAFLPQSALSIIQLSPMRFQSQAFVSTSLRISGGCVVHAQDSSTTVRASTTAIQVKIPTGLLLVRARQSDLWRTNITTRALPNAVAIDAQTDDVVTEAVDTITFTFRDPVPDAAYQVIELSFWVQPLEQIWDQLTELERKVKDEFRIAMVNVTQFCNDTAVVFDQLKNDDDDDSATSKHQSNLLAPLLYLTDNPSVLTPVSVSDYSSTNTRGIAIMGLVLALVGLLFVLFSILSLNRMNKDMTELRQRLLNRSGSTIRTVQEKEMVGSQIKELGVIV